MASFAPTKDGEGILLAKSVALLRKEKGFFVFAIRSTRKWRTGIDERSILWNWRRPRGSGIVDG